MVASTLIRHRCTVPATWGVAIDVPDQLSLPPFKVVEFIATPGAKMSTQLP